MVYSVTFPSILIDWSVSIAWVTFFAFGIWKSIIVDLVAIFQKGVYIFSSCFISRSPTVIGFNQNLPPLIILLIILKHMRLTSFSDDSNWPLNTVKLVVSEVLLFHENTCLIPSGDSYDFSFVNNGTTEHITLLFVGITFRNQLGWVEAVNFYWVWGTNPIYIFHEGLKMFNIA